MKRVTTDDMEHLPFMNGDRIANDVGSLLVLAPHPDDETLGCGGLIAMLRTSGVEVSIVFITSGSASHPNSKSHPPELLSKIREQEAIEACKSLNVSGVNVHFLRCQDSKLNAMTTSELDDQTKILLELIDVHSFKTIALPWRKDPHPDHIVTSQIGNILIKNYNSQLIKLEYLIWLWENGKEEDWPLTSEVSGFKLDISGFENQKRQAMEQHQSQLGQMINDDPLWFCYDG